MRTSLPTAIAHVLASEGGYVNHPRDPGGCTNFGITLATLRRHLRPRADCSDVRRLTRREAARIYETAYWRAVRADDLPAGIDLLAFDMGVNAGPATAARLLQDVVGTTRDGVIGPITLGAVARQPLADLIDAYGARRLSYYRDLDGWPAFGRGWARRVNAARDAALTLLQKKSP